MRVPDDSLLSGNQTLKPAVDDAVAARSLPTCVPPTDELEPSAPPIDSVPIEAPETVPPTDSLSIEAPDTVVPTERDASPVEVPPMFRMPGYLIEGVLGKGGMGIVYKARQAGLNRHVALKMILHADHADVDERLRFLREAESLARLQHPNIVQIYEIGVHEGKAYFSLEYVDGGSLDRYLAGNPQPAQEAAALVEVLARGVQAAHDAGVIHRDLKPANVLLARRRHTSADFAKPEPAPTDVAPSTVQTGGRLHSTGARHSATRGSTVGSNAPTSVIQALDGWIPKITDFGLAKTVGDAGQTQSGAIMGTPSYMAPEQASGQVKTLDGRADIWALGAILYECLTGRPPFRAATPLDTVLLVVRLEPVSPSQLNPAVPRDLETVCLKCLQKEPGKRYQSAAELADDLGRFVRGEPVQARPVGRLERAWRWSQRNPGLAGSMAAAVLALLLGTAVSILFGVQADQGRRNAERALDRAEREQKARVLAQLNTLRDAAPAAVPPVVAELQRAGDEILPRLRELWEQEDGDHLKRMRVGLALLAVEPATVRDQLAAWMLRAEDPAEVLLIRDTLAPHGAMLTNRLWTTAADDKAKPAERLRALVALAAFAEEDGRWKELAPVAVEQMLADNQLHLGTWVKGLKPVRRKMLVPLGDMFRTAKLPERREYATTVLADYAADEPDDLAQLLLDANPKQYAMLFPLIEKHRAQVVERMKQALVRVPDYWKDGPLDPSWSAVPDELRREIEQAEGIVAERFALCQALPSARLGPVTEGLRKDGFRPVRVRPVSSPLAPREIYSVVWTRDSRDWRLETNLAPFDAKERDAHWQKAGYVASDAACGFAGVHTLLWAKARPGEQSNVYVYRPAHLQPFESDLLIKSGFAPATLQASVAPNGTVFYCGVSIKGPRFGAVALSWNIEEPAHAGTAAADDMLLVDVDLAPVAPISLAIAQFGQPLLLAVPNIDQRYSHIRYTSATLDAMCPHGLGATAHLARCRELAAQGWRPAALSLALLPGANTPTAASVWHRPALSMAEKEREGRATATAAATLLRLNAPSTLTPNPSPTAGMAGKAADAAWPVFRHRPDPTARSYLVERCNLLGVTAADLVDRLECETEVSARRALILALGDYGPDQIHATLLFRTKETLVKWYHDDPDPGIHTAIDWLLRHKKEGPVDRPLDWGGAAALDKVDAELKERTVDMASRSRKGPDEEPAPGWSINGQGQTMILIPGPVQFRVGSPRSDPDAFGDSARPHIRHIPRSFAIASKPVTVEQWERFLTDVPDARSQFAKPSGPDEPITVVTWYQAAQYCNWLSDQEDIPESEWCYPKHQDIKPGMKPYPDYLQRKGYRLPTDTEWEYAARAGAETSRYDGDSRELLARHAWYIGNSQERIWPVGQKRPNDLGLFDAVGNVATWCGEPSLPWDLKAARGRPLVDNENTDANSTLRIARGGSFASRPSNLRSATRSYTTPSVPIGDLGLRVARTYD